MKNFALMAFASLISLSTFAQVPVELQNLIPVGSKSIRMEGRTKSMEKCTISISSEHGIFYASITTPDENGQIPVDGLAKFQLGFGHELQSLDEKNNTLVAVSTHEAEEQYSSDTRSTLYVKRMGPEISAVQIRNEDKFLFVYKTDVNLACYLNF